MRRTDLTAAAGLRSLRGLRHMIGNTPLLELHYRYRGRNGVIFAKAEHLNMTGSIKDRMAYHILKTAYEKGLIGPQHTIVEATSGNTGISLAAVGTALGHQVLVYMPDWMSRERVSLIKSLGARIVPVSREQGGFLGSIRMTEELAANDENVFLPRQFSNDANVAAHEETTGREIWWQLCGSDRAPDAFVAGVGTGGTIMGVGRFLRRRNSAIKLYPLEPAESPTLSTGCKAGRHRIQGVSDEFIPPILQLDFVDEVLSVHDGDAVLMAQNLASRLGLAVGISSGANFLGAVIAQAELGYDAVVATVFPDDNKKYLSTDLIKEEPMKDGYLAPAVELLGYNAIKRVCNTCFEEEGPAQEI